MCDLKLDGKEHPMSKRQIISGSKKKMLYKVKGLFENKKKLWIREEGSENQMNTSKQSKAQASKKQRDAVP